MEYFQKVRSTVTSAVQQVGNVVAGNPILREFDLDEQVGSAGPALQWKIHKGRKKSTKQPVSVWMFDKKQIDGWNRDDQTRFLDLIKRGVNQLTRVRHPRVLTVEHPLEEGRESLAFCTEPVLASLANCLGKVDNVPASMHAVLKENQPTELENRCGIKQVAEALAFLHNDAKILHRNVCPNSIIVNDKGEFKLAGFDFAMSASSNENGTISCDSSDIDDHIIWQLLPEIDFLAPEIANGARCDPFSDIFSLGMVVYCVYNNGASPLQCKHRLESLRQKVDILQYMFFKLKSIPMDWCLKVPEHIRDDFKLCLNKTPSLRPDAAQFTKINSFNDHRLTTIHTLESLMQFDNTQKMNIFKQCPNSLVHIDKRPLLRKIRPLLVAEFSTPEMVPFILPSIFYMAEQCTKSEFSALIMPELVPVFKMQRPYQIVLLLLNKMDLILSLCNEQSITEHVLPLLYSSIGNENMRIQELCLSILPKIGNLISRQNMKVDVLPKLLKLAAEGQVLSIRVQSLLCLGKLLSSLEEWMVSDQIFPALPKINAKEPGLLMAILGIYQRVFSSFNVNKDLWARSALPFMIASSVDPSLNAEQYGQYTTLIHSVMAKVEEEHRAKLQQLSAGQQAQLAGVASSVSLAPSTATTSDSMNTLGTVFAEPAPTIAPPPAAGTSGKSNVLSLEEKRRLAAEQESIRNGTVSGKGTPTLASMQAASSSTPSVPNLSSSSKGPLMSSRQTPMSMTSSTPVISLDALDPFSNLNTSAPSKTQPINTSAVNSTFGGSCNMMGFSPFPASNTSAANTTFGDGFSSFAPMGSSTHSTMGGFLPGPPSSSNTAVQRRTAGAGAFDDLLSFGSKATQSQSLNKLAAGSGAQPVMPGLQNISLGGTKTANALKAQQFDPLADFLG